MYDKPYNGGSVRTAEVHIHLSYENYSFGVKIVLTSKLNSKPFLKNCSGNRS